MMRAHHVEEDTPRGLVRGVGQDVGKERLAVVGILRVVLPAIESVGRDGRKSSPLGLVKDPASGTLRTKGGSDKTNGIRHDECNDSGPRINSRHYLLGCSSEMS